LNHEKWVQTTINNEINSQKKSQPIFLTRIISGKELLNIISNSHGYRTDYDEIENKEDSEYIGGVLQNLVDYGDISGMVETFDSVKIGFELNKFLKDLDEKGYNLFGEKGIKQTKFSNGETDKWSIATIVIKKKDNSEILKVDLNEKDQNASA